MSARIVATAVAFALASVPHAHAEAGKERRPDEPWAELVSTRKAFDYVLREVCLPAVAEGRSIGELAKYNILAGPVGGVGGAPKDVKTWRLASLTAVDATDWNDGSCMVSVVRGNAAELRAATLERLAIFDPSFAPGLVQPARDGKAVREAFCTAGDHPLAAAITTPALNAKGRALVVTVFRAKGLRPSLCTPETANG